jgi:hypothetical protein
MSPSDYKQCCLQLQVPLIVGCQQLPGRGGPRRALRPAGGVA